jgi:Carboxypeptidase regulatory-like domain/TonB dependent receptor/TonB-dependent Receptor Plug Domain
MSSLYSLVRYLCCCALVVTPLFAQFESGTVLGTVQDPTGATVAGATVTLENIKTGINQQTQTSSNGDYQFVNVRLGTYRVRVEAPGFQTSTTSDFDLSVNARQRVDLSLQVGNTTQNITVSDAVALLETDNSSRGQVITPKQIVDLPLNGRSYADLTLLVPGTARSPLENQSDSSRDASFNVNGLRSELNNFMLDGIDNNAYGTSNQGFSNQVIQPNPDALAEFKVETDNYSAEFGRSPGAVINATIKSGTNQLHGELWEFLRNTDLNAVGFFKPANGTKPRFNQNQFGAALGGPIVKNKIFVFGDYEGFRRVFHPVQFATVPTAAMKAGNFGIPVRNPITGVLYSNGIVPASAITPFAQAVLSALPDPNLPGTANNFQSAPADPIYNDKGDIRYDETFGQKVTAFARYSQNDTRIFSPASIPGPAGGNANGNVYIRNKQLVPGVTWSLSPTSILEIRAGLDYTEAGKTPIGLGNTISQFNLPNLPTDPAFAGGLYTLNMAGGLSQLGRQNSNPQYQYPLVVDPKVNYSKALSSHSLKFGFEYQLIDTQVQDFHPKYGVDNYSGFFSSPNYPSTSGLSSLQQQIYSVADLMFGARSHYELNNYAVAHLRQRMYFGYVQDDYKVNSRLTLNLGLRYEFATPQWERDNKLSNFDPVTGTMISARNGSLYDRALVHPDPYNLAPRVGLAYQITPKTVMRSAYGVSYVLFNRLGGENLLAYNGPNIVDAIIDQVPGQGTGTCTSVNSAPGSCFRPTYLGFPPNFATPAAFNPATTQVRYIPANNRNGYVQSWHFTVQQDLGHNMRFDLAYVANHSVGLMILADANQAVPNQATQNLSVNARRPYRNFTTIEEAFAGGFGTYNALQAKWEKRYSAGLYFINSFTWSKAIDNAPGHLENYNGDNSRINSANPKSERGISSYDQPFNNTTSIVYDLPFGHGRHFNMTNRLVDAVAGGWAVNVINTVTSGLPINITYSPTTQGTVSPLVTPRPNLTGSSLYTSNSDPTRYLSLSAFSIPSFTQPFGNAGRNIARGPYFQQLDLGLHKNFRLWSESSRMEFRAEAFNLLNKTNFNVNSGLTTSVSSSSYGIFTQTLPPRQVQLALKLVF